jgi:tetratricopeptide (TPR) repeat protein
VKQILLSLNLIALAAIVFSGCSSRSMPTNAPTLPPDATAGNQRGEVLCPTENEQARILYNDAIELQDQGQREQAKELYQNAIELDPSFCDAMDNLGQMLRSQGSVEEAIYWYERSIEVLPNNTVAHQNLAVAYKIQGRIADAITQYELIVQIDPDNPEGYYGLGSIYLDSGQPEQAVTQFKRAEELYAKESSPLIQDARYGLGVSYYRLEECEKARDYFEQIYPEKQDNPYTNYFYGLCYLCPEIKDLELAERYLSKAKELGVDIPESVLQQLSE